MKNKIAWAGSAVVLGVAINLGVPYVAALEIAKEAFSLLGGF